MSKLDQLFRARPVEFAAVQASAAIHAAANAWGDLPDWLIAAYNQGFVVFTPGWIDLTTSMGPVRVAPQDWILCSANEMSICKGEAWERTYEPAPELGVSDRTIAGHCPMGCGTTLFVGAGGHITCSNIPCPNPTAVDTILAERETEHIVQLKQHDFSILHPLRERLDNELLRCDLHAYLIGLDGPPRQPGRYRARRDIDGAWVWETAQEES